LSSACETKLYGKWEKSVKGKSATGAARQVIGKLGKEFKTCRWTNARILYCERLDSRLRKSLLIAYSAAAMKSYPVGQEVNLAQAEHAQLAEPRDIQEVTNFTVF
jgi:hypothetical protein